MAVFQEKTSRAVREVTETLEVLDDVEKLRQRSREEIECLGEDCKRRVAAAQSDALATFQDHLERIRECFESVLCRFVDSDAAIHCRREAEVEVFVVGERSKHDDLMQKR